MNSAWIAVIGTLAGSVMGGLISYFNTRQQLKHQEARERKKHHLDKLDEMFKAAGELPRLFWDNAISAHLREETIDDIGMIRSSVSHVERLSFLSGAYFPELFEQVHTILNCCAKCQNLLNDARQAREKGSAMKMSETLRESLSALDKACSAAQTKIAEMAGRYI